MDIDHLFYYLKKVRRAFRICYLRYFIHIYPVKGRRRHIKDYLIKSYVTNQSFDTVIVIAVYNRSKYLNKTLKSLKKTILRNTLLILVDDGSDDTQVLDQFEINIPLIKIYKAENIGMWDSLVIGFDYALRYFPTIEILINLDSDTIHKKNWLQKLLELHKRFPHSLVSGFNTDSHNSFDEPKKKDYVVKKSLGGLNLCFKKKLYYQKYRSTILLFKIAWDWGLVIVNRFYHIPMLTTKPSVVEHIGKFGTNTRFRFDRSVDF